MKKPKVGPAKEQGKEKPDAPKPDFGPDPKASPELIAKLFELQQATYSGVITVQLDPGFDVPEATDLLEIARKRKLDELDRILSDLKPGASRRLFAPALMPKVRALEEVIYASKKFEGRPRLTSYWRIDIRGEEVNPERVKNRLSKSRGIKEAYREFSARPASLPSCPVVRPEIHEFTQRYLCPAPVGIDVRPAWARSKGNGIRVIDVELGWALPHEDIVSDVRLVGGDVSPLQPNLFHGTAVLGILAAGHNAAGISGIAPKVDWIGCASTYNQRDATVTNIAAAIVDGILATQKGDIILVEMERNHFLGNGMPVEIDATDALAIAWAVAVGRVVIEAAGNAVLDLKHVLNPTFQDFPAIMVGGCGGCETPRSRTYASNYGERIDCFAWGSDVETCGYGDLQGTVPNDFYTGRFSASSAASAIVAGAAALVQSIAVNSGTRAPLSPEVLREYFSTYGTIQPTMGVMPDLDRILKKL